MKWFVASDIHGSQYYCNKMIEAFKQEKADKMLLLGDILYHGPRNDLPKDYNPKSVISMLNDMKENIICVRGNCDTEVDQMVLEFPIMADYSIIVDNDFVIYATHGHIYNEKNIPPIQKGTILLNGHTHIPKYVKHETYIYMNPGSVSLPKENSWHGYMIIENNSIIWKDFDNNIKLNFVKENTCIQ